MRKIVCLLLITFGIFSCKSNEDKIDEYINSIPLFPTQLDNSFETNTVATDEWENGKRYSCYTKSGKEKQTLSDFITFNPTVGKLYPGALIQGRTLESGLFTTIDIKQSGGTFTVHNVIFKDTTQIITLTQQNSKPQNDKSKSSIWPNKELFDKGSLIIKEGYQDYDTLEYSKHINEVTAPFAIQVKVDLLSKLPQKDQVARIYFNKEVVESLEKSFLDAHVSIEWMKRKFKAEITNLQQSKYSKYLVKVVQPYYDITFDPDYKTELNPHNFFRKDISSKGLIKKFESYKNSLGDTINPPVYVYSVTYGRMLLIIAESSENIESLRKAMDVSFSSRLVKGSAGVSSESLKVLKNSTFTIFSVGGSAAATVKVLTAGNEHVLDSLQSYLRVGANYSPKSPAFPISYTTRYLKNNDDAKIGFAFKFSVPICTENPRTVKGIKVKIFVTEDNKDDDESIKMTIIKNGNIRLAETPSLGYGEDWKENSAPRDFYIPTNNLLETDLPNTNFAIYKSPEHGGGCGAGGGMVFTFMTIAVLDDGTEIDWRASPRIIMGNCSANYQVF